MRSINQYFFLSYITLFGYISVSFLVDVLFCFFNEMYVLKGTISLLDNQYKMHYFKTNFYTESKKKKSLITRNDCK